MQCTGLATAMMMAMMMGIAAAPLGTRSRRVAGLPRRCAHRSGVRRQFSLGKKCEAYSRCAQPGRAPMSGAPRRAAPH